MARKIINGNNKSNFNKTNNNVQNIQAALGHSSPKTTEIYTQLTDAKGYE